MKKLNILIIILLTCLSCDKEPKFYYLESESKISQGVIYKHVVISNPPENLDSLALLVSKYSNKNFKIKKMLDDNKRFNIFFYHETSSTTKDFKSDGDDCDWGKKNIGCQTDGIICALKNNTGRGKGFSFILRKKYEEEWIDFKYNFKNK